ncbi:MAG: succinate dehydrogenase, cytochrome b556 subunit [Betaproteobacteria bacterium]|nr:MAG: succinate dehydrogenase, cytochrome b556 subunit [Betaproteobacteria bacterium]
MSSRPKHLNLYQIRLPLPGFVSILHRISGFGMFAFAWAILWLLQISLQSPESYEQARTFVHSWIGKLFLIGMSWAFLHHFFAGLRFLLLDTHVGVDLQGARRTSWVVLALSIVGTMMVGTSIW